MKRKILQSAKQFLRFVCVVVFDCVVWGGIMMIWDDDVVLLLCCLHFLSSLCVLFFVGCFRKIHHSMAFTTKNDVKFR